MAKSTYAPEMHTIESVLGFFDEYADGPGMYQLYIGHDQDPVKFRGQVDYDEPGSARLKLEESLLAVQVNPENTNPYSIFIYKISGKKKEIIAASTFQLNKKQSLQPYYPGMMPAVTNNHDELNALRSELRAIREELAARDLDDEEQEEQEPGGIMGLMADPQVKAAILAGLGNIFGAKRSPGGLAGINTQSDPVVSDFYDMDEKIYGAIDILKKKDPKLGDHLIILSDLAVNNPHQFQLLLTMLTTL